MIAVATKNGSAEIYEIDDARARLRDEQRAADEAEQGAAKDEAFPKAALDNDALKSDASHSNALDSNALESDEPEAGSSTMVSRNADALLVKDFSSAGAYLSAVREKQGLTLDDISGRTHIKRSFLEAIEANDLSALPSRPFALGFVKGYGEALGLDSASVLEQFKKDADFRAQPDVERVLETPVVAEPTAPPERPEMSLIAVVAVIIFMIWCAWQITRPREMSEPFRFNQSQIVTPHTSQLHDTAVHAEILTPIDEGDLPAAKSVSTPAALERAALQTPAEGLPAEPLPIVVEARPIDAHSPIYPPKCEADARADERVEVGFTVKVDGKIAAERVLSATNPCFERAALNAVRRWTYAPRTVDGTPQPAFEQRHTFVFKRPL